MVLRFQLSDDTSLDALTARLSERVGAHCSLDGRVLRCRRLGATADLVRSPHHLDAEIMLPALPYFTLQLQLAVADLGGHGRSLVGGETRAAPIHHPQANLTWSELPVTTRAAQGPLGSTAIGVVVMALTVVLLLTLPLQLLLPARWTAWLKEPLSRLGTRAMLRQ